MALSVNGGGGIGSRRQRGNNSSLAEINVTPFVDVVLVLLVIFMITAHVMESSIQVDVPKVRVSHESTRDLPVVTITKDGNVYLNGQPVALELLKATIENKFGKGKAVYVMADKEAIWDPIAQVTAELNETGFQVNMVTQPADSPARGKK